MSFTLISKYLKLKNELPAKQYWRTKVFPLGRNYFSLSYSPAISGWQERNEMLKGHWQPFLPESLRPTLSKEEHDQEEYKQKVICGPYTFIFTPSKYVQSFLIIYTLSCEHWEEVRAFYNPWNRGAEISALPKIKGQNYQVSTEKRISDIYLKWTLRTCSLVQSTS